MLTINVSIPNLATARRCDVSIVATPLTMTYPHVI